MSTARAERAKNTKSKILLLIGYELAPIVTDGLERSEL